MTPESVVKVLGVFEQADLFEGLMWRQEDGEVRMYVNCNDLFYWATADCEEILAEDIPLLLQTLKDLKAVDETYYLPELFAARKRKLRPQKPCYKRFSKATATMFDACGTQKERDEATERDSNWWGATAYLHKKENK